MKTILYQPIFINPQAYFVFPQLYHIEKGDSYIEPANITGQLIINDLTKSLTSTPILNDELLYKPDIRVKGTFAQKPVSSQGIYQGFSYFCTDKQTTEGSRNGIMIYYVGDDTWTDALGRYIH